MKRLLCLVGLHEWLLQLHSFKDDSQAVLSTGEPLPVVAYCWNCGKKREGEELWQANTQRN